MSFFNSSEPLLRDKQQELDFQDLQGLWRFRCKIGNVTLFSRFYSRIDQTFVLWGLISSSIFVTAQFLPVSWTTQAILWSALTLVGTASMVALTWYWVSVERLRWVIYCWVILMLFGLVLTDLGIFLSWGEVLMRLCPLWLALSALGYLFTGLGMRSRTFIFVGVIHLLGIAILPYVAAWCFLTTGLIMTATLLPLAEWQWDMRPPINYAYLTAEQKQFNCKQHQLRQVVS
ncbi:MAG: hypothetical protein JOZ78_12295 [Chroococcidiopsidaceae cyanobacterium CP_BM_ER_R8_30]|nr:hypothetical protein [Chroococcidiopsidaceae cyanobacterium CP_BM_ER_R8_30]